MNALKLTSNHKLSETIPWHVNLLYKALGISIYKLDYLLRFYYYGLIKKAIDYFLQYKKNYNNKKKKTRIKTLKI